MELSTILVLATVVLAVAVAFVSLAQARRTRRVLVLADRVGDLPPRAGIRENLVGQLEEVLSHIDQGIVIVSDTATPVFANEGARRLLGLPEDALPPRLPLPDLAPMLRRVLSGDGPVENLVVVDSRDRLTLSVRAAALASENGALLTLRDVSEEARSQSIRRQFVAHASHELKSPIASIQTLAEAVSNAAVDDPTRVPAFADRLVGEAQRLGRLVTDLLDLSRLEEPTVISSRRVDLSEVVRRELARVRDADPAPPVVITERIEPQVQISGDEEQLSALVRNLLENAVRYSFGEGSVLVTLSRTDDEVLLQVQDDGVGIPIKSQGRVFERFYRVDEARTRAKGGTGLGLAIVKHVTELHGGVVGLQSELGEGSTFTVRLPAASG